MTKQLINIRNSLMKKHGMLRLLLTASRDLHLKGKNDYPDISKKPIDDPFGPYADTFSESQHKYGPFQPIEEAIRKS